VVRAGRYVPGEMRSYTAVLGHGRASTWAGTGPHRQRARVTYATPARASALYPSRPQRPDFDQRGDPRRSDARFRRRYDRCRSFGGVRPGVRSPRNRPGGAAGALFVGENSRGSRNESGSEHDV
jgi:hypothetical protein